MSTRNASIRAATAALRRLAPLARLERRARRLQLVGSALASARSRRLRAHILRRLAPDRDLTMLGSEELPSEVSRALKREAAPVRSLAAAVLVLASATAAFLGVLFALTCVLSPVVRVHFFPPDLAARASWQLSSTFPGMSATGVGAGGPGPLFFHTLEENSPSITIVFPRPISPRTITIHNREDCCQERALPLNVESVGEQGEQLLCQRRAPFQTWTCRTQGVRTQRLRIRRPGPTILHLAKIEVYE